MLSVTRRIFLVAARSVIEMVENRNVAEQWSQPSALTGYTVGGLAAHLCRAVSTTDGYLDRSTPPGPPTVANAAEYFRAALGDHDPIDSDMHLEVRQRSGDMAASGYIAVLDATRAAFQSLTGKLEVEPDDRLIEVFGGAVMTVDDYLETRIVELVIHTDDLAASCRGLDVTVASDAWEVARRVVAELAALRVGDRAFVLGLSRAERAQRPLAF